MSLIFSKAKTSVTVLIDKICDVRDALYGTWMGAIGNYHCITAMKCLGTFNPNDNANSYIGEKNNLEFVEEKKLEVIYEGKMIKKVISSLRKVHPYEESVIDIIPLIEDILFD